MMQIHCHACGGFMGDLSSISYRLLRPAEAAAAPRSGLCTCGAPIVYGPDPGPVPVSSPGMPMPTVSAPPPGDVARLRPL